MADYITIDGGTTNTRINLVKNYDVIDTLKLSIGAKFGIDRADDLRLSIKNGIAEILNRNSVHTSDITAILASGMITSEFGLYMLKHIETPAGICELHNTMEKVVIKDLSGIPFVFVRGVKICSDSVSEADMMRGEETELIGIMSKADGECIYVLPGSHSKIICTDENGVITGFSTTLTGEIIAALSHHTIVKDAVSLDNFSLDKDELLAGFTYSEKNGINEALFKVRVLKNMFNKSPEEIYSFFIGAILCGEVKRILKYIAPKIIIGGKGQIRNALDIILNAVSDRCVVCLSDEVTDNATSNGMIRIYEYH